MGLTGHAAQTLTRGAGRRWTEGERDCRPRVAIGGVGRASGIPCFVDRTASRGQSSSRWPKLDAAPPEAAPTPCGGIKLSRPSMQPRCQRASSRPSPIACSMKRQLAFASSALRAFQARVGHRGTEGTEKTFRTADDADWKTWERAMNSRGTGFQPVFDLKGRLKTWVENPCHAQSDRLKPVLTRHWVCAICAICGFPCLLLSCALRASVVNFSLARNVQGEVRPKARGH
jgi:hypothetical protein